MGMRFSVVFYFSMLVVMDEAVYITWADLGCVFPFLAS